MAAREGSPCFCHFARGARRVGADHGFKLKLADDAAALAERHDVALHGLDRL